MRYRSARGTTINIPDNLTPAQIAKIKADADAGYGTRAQQTARALAGRATATPSEPLPPATATPDTPIDAPVDTPPPLADNPYEPKLPDESKLLPPGSRAAPPATPSPRFSTVAKPVETLETMLARTQGEIKRRGGIQNAPNYAMRVRKIQRAIKKRGTVPAPVPAPETTPEDDDIV